MEYLKNVKNENMGMEFSSKVKTKIKYKTKIKPRNCAKGATDLGFERWMGFSVAMVFCFIFLVKVVVVNALPENIKIGGLFDIVDGFEEVALRHAVQRVNNDPNILPRSTLSASVEQLPLSDSFRANKKVCQILKGGIAGIIGPQSPSTSSHVQSVCDALKIPHVETKWNFRSSRGNFHINLYPHPATLSRAFADLIEAWGWNRYVIIYENNESLVRLQDILKASHPDSRQATVKQLPPGEDYRPLFKEIRMNTDINNFIIDCDSSKLPLIFDHASQVNMMRNYRYFITSLDIQTLDLESYLFGDINITSFRLVDRHNHEVVKVIKAWQHLVDFGFDDKSQNSRYSGNRSQTHRNRNRVVYPTTSGSFGKILPLPNNMLKTETALIYDAVELYGRALQALDNSQRGTLTPQSLHCNPTRPQDIWKQGHLLMDALKKVQFKGLSGVMEFDNNGYRSEFLLDIMELTQKGLMKIGSWNSSSKTNPLQWTRTRIELLKIQEEDLRNKTLIVSTIQSEPFFIVANGTSEGYAIDLLDLLAETLNFNYVVKEAVDGSYGVPNNKSKFGWDGVIGEILAGTADIGIGDMTITHDRERTLDFTMPFMNLGISILYKRPQKIPPSLFSFFKPLHSEIWIYIASAYLGITILLFLIARLTPYEWLNPHTCIEEPEELELQLHFSNTLWFTTGSIVQQGLNISPQAASTRTVASIWWFFTLIMISSYTANLAAFLTSEGMQKDIKDIQDLPRQTKVKYGSMGTGSTFQFFKTSNFPLYKEIYNSMQGMRPSPFVRSVADGVERVKESDGSYAFFMESATIEYEIEKDCSLTQLGGLIDSKGYGIALRKNSKYKDAFNSRILELQEKGELEKLKVKWWKGKEKEEGNCKPGASPTGGAQPLTLGHFGGVFVILLGGCGLAFLVAFLEFLWKARKIAHIKHINKMHQETISRQS